MKKQKGENKIVLCMLLLACLLSVVPVVPSRAGWLDFGWETLEYTDEEEKMMMNYAICQPIYQKLKIRENGGRFR